MALLQKGISDSNGYWADLGSGDGAFTLALLELLPRESVLLSIDRAIGSLKRQKKSIITRFPDKTVHLIAADIERHLPLPQVNGILMANSLHYIREKETFLKKLLARLTDFGNFLLVEYNTRSSNRWVPYPITFSQWQSLSLKIGFKETGLLQTHPSRYHNEIYAAISRKLPGAA